MTQDESHLSVGLQDRDRVNTQIGGGFPTGSIILLEGEDGSGKSSLSQRFSYGFCEEGSEVTYISTELDAPGFIEQMHSLSYGVTDHLLEDNLLFLNADIDTHTVDGEAVGNRELLPKLQESAEMWNRDVIVIDEFGAMLRNDPGFDSATQNGDGDHAMQSLLKFFREITRHGKILILTVAPNGIAENALRPLRESADIYFEIGTAQVGSEIRHNIAVRRFLEMKQPVDDTIGFAVQQGRGVVIESRTVA